MRSDSTLTSDGSAEPPDLPVSPEPPREFGDYLLLDEIGRGGMGVVYEARQKRLDRVVALKLIVSGSWASPEERRRFHREARAAARLAHPNIVKILDAGEHGGQPYIAMELVRGRSLADALREGSMRIRDAAVLVHAVAGALDHLHRHGLVHRDLKPANILLGEAARPYVTDFGLANVLGEERGTRTGTVAGTPSYMSPEQAAGRTAELDARSDVYSLGAILYELLTGRPPALADTLLDTLIQVIERDPPAPRHVNGRVPRDLETICLRCLAKLPQDRYPTAGALRDDLDRFLAAEPIEARPADLGQRIARWARREPPLALRLSGLGLFYAVELANYFLFHSVSRDWHVTVSILIGAWAVLSVGFQQVLKHERWENGGIYAWGAVDAAFLTTILLRGEGAASPLVVAFPLLVVASGLWVREKFVTFMTALCLAAYAVLVADFYLRRTELQVGFDRDADRHVFFALALALTGAAVRYQVGRARALGRFCAGRRAPWLRASGGG